MFRKLFGNLIHFHTRIPSSLLAGIYCNSQLTIVWKAPYL